MIQVLYFTSIKWDLDPSPIFMSLGADMPSAARFGILIGIDGRDTLTLRQLQWLRRPRWGRLWSLPRQTGLFFEG